MLILIIVCLKGYENSVASNGNIPHFQYKFLYFQIYLSTLSNTDEISENMLKHYVELADEEAFVKDYHVATIKDPDYGEAHLSVTSKRMIMYAWTKDTIQINSADIADVRGIDISWSKRKRTSLGIALMVIGSILTIPVIAYVLLNPFVIIGLIISVPLLAIGLYYIVTIRHSFVVIINIKAATGALTFYSYSKDAVQRGIDPDKLELNAVPVPEAKIMAQELGALILNMQEE